MECGRSENGSIHPSPRRQRIARDLREGRGPLSGSQFGGFCRSFYRVGCDELESGGCPPTKLALSLAEFLERTVRSHDTHGHASLLESVTIELEGAPLKRSSCHFHCP